MTLNRAQNSDISGASGAKAMSFGPVPSGVGHERAQRRPRKGQKRTKGARDGMGELRTTNMGELRTTNLGELRTTNLDQLRNAQRLRIY